MTVKVARVDSPVSLFGGTAESYKWWRKHQRSSDADQGENEDEVREFEEHWRDLACLGKLPFAAGKLAIYVHMVDGKGSSLLHCTRTEQRSRGKSKERKEEQRAEEQSTTTPAASSCHIISILSMTQTLVQWHRSCR